MASANGGFGVIPMVGESGRYHVKSAAKKEAHYLVDLNEMAAGWCGCPHFEFRIMPRLTSEIECKHIRSARSYQRLQQRFTKKGVCA